jgi:hypothetical protein
MVIGEGNRIFMAGIFNGNADFGLGPAIYNLTSSGYNLDGFLAAYIA